MNQNFKVKKNDVKEILKLTYPDYAGRKFFVNIKDKVYVQLGWQEGTCTYYKLVREDEQGNLKVYPIENYLFDRRNFQDFGIDDETIVVTHSFFCGHETGVTFIVSPNSKFLLKNLIPKAE